ncbi:zinc-binding dehydrogenase [Burkholderia pseudomallei]|uniref:zinc-binding dehydrogenase n=1 Tax=Burkholderia pseudomallei TaxID=28450 RepID=UPI001D021FF9|nr:zinc-binding dehydrogenase [Burkholderia pseudomallei]
MRRARRRTGALPAVRGARQEAERARLPVQARRRRSGEARRRARFVLDGLASGALKPTLDRVFPLDRIADAHRYPESNERFGEIAVTV